MASEEGAAGVVAAVVMDVVEREEENKKKMMEEVMESKNKEEMNSTTASTSTPTTNSYRPHHHALSSAERLLGGGDSDEDEVEAAQMALADKAEEERAEEDDKQKKRRRSRSRSRSREKRGSRHEDEDEDEEKERERRRRDFLKERKALPAYAYREEIVNAVKNNQVVVIIGETGSGKSTQIPQFIYDDILKPNHERDSSLPDLVGVTQPRRVGAVSVARRVAEERGWSDIGGEVGYCVRFSDRSSKTTRIRYLTDGTVSSNSTPDSISCHPSSSFLISQPSLNPHTQTSI